ncbi:NEP1-interacting protein 1-like isoform X4 [Camellia sinensis]|uniref:NEP1-interacting protein 1-like isoform X4 n=1 Tax=Camellia sinensis TaxID=4442 RepID=UPI0010357CDA|nr:NEP1-interacting protein 1-like isoform X4 [Camellia sinensis]
MEVWSCPTIPTLQRPWWWRWISIGGEEERRRKREFCSSVFSALLHYLFYAFFSFFFAVVGTTVGAMTGAVFGMKSERKIGLVHGAAVGAFTGASFFLHVVNASFAFWISFHDNEPPSFHLFVATVETNNQVPRFLDRKGGNALHRGSILDKLPKTKITDKNIYDSSGNRISCSVCLEDFEVGEVAERLPICLHMFHRRCIAKWRVRHRSCPLCRTNQ